eukprot:Nk52_evm1s2521 gene=Nk52_evmTU1s2521
MSGEEEEAGKAIVTSDQEGVLTDQGLEESIYQGKQYRFFSCNQTRRSGHGAGPRRKKHSEVHPCLFMGEALPLSVLPGGGHDGYGTKLGSTCARGEEGDFSVGQQSLIGYSTPIQRLNFEVASCDGGEFEENYRAANILKADQSVYCSQKGSNVNIVLRLADMNEFNLTHALFRIPESGYTAPAKEGLLFVFHHYPDVHRTNIFNDFNKARYDAFVHGIQSSPRSEYDPKAFFRIERGKTSTLVSFDYPLSGKWIVLKLIRSVRTTVIPRRNWLSIVRSMRRHRQDFVSRISEIARRNIQSSSMQHTRSALLGNEEEQEEELSTNRDDDHFTDNNSTAAIIERAASSNLLRDANGLVQQNLSTGDQVEEVREEENDDSLWDGYTSSENNIDIQYCGFAGFVGRMGFAQADLL